MNKILPIILVVVLSGCASSPKYYDRNNISWDKLEKCNLSIPECIASNEVCLGNPKKCRFKPYSYIYECKNTAAECRHEKAMISQKVTSILIGKRGWEKGSLWSSIWPTYEWKNKYTGKKGNADYIEKQCNELSQLNWIDKADDMPGNPHYAEASFFLAPWIISDYKNKCMERQGYYKYKIQ